MLFSLQATLFSDMLKPFLCTGPLCVSGQRWSLSLCRRRRSFPTGTQCSHWNTRIQTFKCTHAHTLSLSLSFYFPFFLKLGHVCCYTELLGWTDALASPTCAVVDHCVLCQLHPLAHEAWRWIILKQASVANMVFAVGGFRQRSVCVCVCVCVLTQQRCQRLYRSTVGTG